MRLRRLRSTGYVEFQENFWTGRARIRGQFGPAYFLAGQNSLARVVSIDERIAVNDYWTWVNPGHFDQRLQVTAGQTRTVSVIVRMSDGTAPRPTLRLRANPALGVAEQTAIAPAVVNTDHTLTLTFTPAATGVVTLRLEWQAMIVRRAVTGETCRWLRIEAA